MKWLGFENPESHLSFAPSLEPATVGAAESNLVRLQSKNMPPLHGQFILEGEKIKYRSFYDRNIQTLEEGRELRILNWKVFCLDETEIWNRYGGEIILSFRKILKDSQTSTFDEVLQSVRGRWFFGGSLPASVESRLLKELGDISFASPVETLLARSSVTDILVSAFDEIWIEQNGELQKSDLSFSSAESYQVYIENLIARIEKSIDDDRPYLDFNLADGSRGHIIAPPLAEKNYQLSIRKIRKDLLTLEELFALEMFSSAQESELRMALDSRKNILVTGATGSGKTTLIRALMHQVPLAQRILVIEDTPELKIQRSNTVFLCSRVDSFNSQRSIDLRQLVRQSLRMRPDRIIIGEVRGGEAMDLLHAMNTGHRGCMGSLHANSARDSIDRLQGLVQMSDARLSEAAIADLIARNLHLIIHCSKDSRGKRFVEEMAFVRGIDQERILLEVKR